MEAIFVTGRRLVASLSIAASLAVPPAAGLAADAEGPVIRHEPVREAVRGEPIIVRATITDPSGVFAPAVYVRVKGPTKFVGIKMRETPKDYLAVIPAEQTESEVAYFIEAFDTLGNGPSRHGGPESPHVVRPRPPPPPPPPPNANSGGPPGAAKSRETPLPPELVGPARAVPDGPPPEGALVVAPPATGAQASAAEDDDGVVGAWWFWTLVGVVVAGSVAGVAVLATAGDDGPVDTVRIDVRGPDPSGGM